MRSHYFFRVFTVLTVVTVSLFSFASTVEAKGTATVGTTLTFEPPVSVSVGNPSIIVIQLMSSKGLPVVNQRINLFVDGVQERTARTDASGNVSIKVRRDLVGTYALYATFTGSRLPSLGSSKASAELVITPALIEIHTTPSLPDVRFSLDRRIFSSDAYGVARIEVEKAGTYHLEILPLEATDANIQMEFGRWGDEIFHSARDIVIPLDKPLEAGFDVSYQVSQTFVDLAYQPVDPQRVTSITLKGSNGTTFTFEDHEPHWLPAGRVIRLNNGLEETKILYSVISVVIDGANVVSQAQQRFYVNPNDVWQVKMLLYSARFTARDALFRFPIGSGIHMEYPDGDVQSFSFNADKEHKSEGLARGIYRVTVTGVNGIAPPTPIALSRDQDVELLVFSYLDIGVLLAIGLMLSLGLLLFGRPYLVTQPIAFAARMLSQRRRIQPVRLQLVNKLSVFVSRLLRKREIVHQENNSDVVDTGYSDSIEEQSDDSAPLLSEAETIGSPSYDEAQYGESIAQSEIPDVAFDHSNEEKSRLAQEPVSMPDAAETFSSALDQAQDAHGVTQIGTPEAIVDNPIDETSNQAPKMITLICRACGNSQTAEQGINNHEQQGYQCDACGAYNNIGSKRTRRSRKKNKAKSLA